MKKSAIILLAITGACLCLMVGIFIGSNALSIYTLRSYSPEENVSSNAENKLNINNATAEELTQLPGIGPKIADRIIAYRTQNGKFATVEDLLNVEGIGYGTLYEIHELITTGG